MEKGKTYLLDLSNYFTDEDAGDILSYTASLDSVGSASLEINGSELVIHGLKPGISLVTINASDGSGGTVSKSFILFVLDSKGATEDKYHIRVVPNPIHGIANVFLKLEEEKKVKIELVGTDGTLRGVLYEGTRSAGSQHIPINLYRYQTGNYMLKFTIGTDISAIQIIKL